MRYSFCIGAVVLFFVPQMSAAYSPAAVSTDAPFSEIVIPMNAVEQNRSYLGVLDSFPHLYEFTVAEPLTLEVQARQRADETAEPINLILVAVNEQTGRISDLGRLSTPLAERNEVFVGGLGIRLIESDFFTADLEPGLYRLEVSTAVNTGPYELNFGEAGVKTSYFERFSTIWEVQRHFGYSWLRYGMSTFILYQIGIVVILLGIYLTWRRGKSA